MLSDAQGVVTMSFHAKRQRLKALEELKCVEGRQRRTGVSKWNGSSPPDIGGLTQGLGINDAVITFFWRVKILVPILMV